MDHVRLPEMVGNMYKHLFLYAIIKYRFVRGGKIHGEIAYKTAFVNAGGTIVCMLSDSLSGQLRR